jgi:hypothetical protein
LANTVGGVGVRRPLRHMAWGQEVWRRDDAAKPGEVCSGEQGAEWSGGDVGRRQDAADSRGGGMESLG